MAYDLYILLNDDGSLMGFDWRSLWPLLLDNNGTSNNNAWALGHALVEYWTKDLNTQQLGARYQFYLQH